MNFLLNKNVRLIAVFSILTGTILLYYPSLFFDFLNWDDEIYIVNNPLIKSFSWDNIIAIFSTPQVNATYSPITLISWSIDYQLAELNPFQYHFTNIVLHTINILLVFVFIRKLSNKFWVGFIVAGLFALHPYQIEVVCWVTGRKDLLMVFFTLLALIMYLNFITKRATKWYILTFLFFLLAVLSKNVIVILPVLLLGIDWYFNKLNKKKWIEKVPFFLLSLFFSYIAFQGQYEGGAIEHSSDLSIFQRVGLASTNYLNFIASAYIPTKLSPLHPMPHNFTANFPILYYFFICLFVGLLYYLYKRRKNRVLIFGGLFFLISIFPVIQFFPIGIAHYAERYGYLPFIGLFFILAMFFVKANWKPIFKFTALGTMLLFFIAKSSIQIGVWENGEKLWEEVINNYPKNEIGYINKADFYRKKGERNRAMLCYRQAIKKCDAPSKSYNQIGFIECSNKSFDIALNHLNTSIEIDNTYGGTFLNRGLCYLNIGELKLAESDFKKSLELDSSLYQAFYNLGLVYSYERKNKQSVKMLSQFLEKSKIQDGYLLRAEQYEILKENNKALKDCYSCLELNKTNTSCLYLKGVLLMQQKNFLQAKNVFNKLIDIDNNNINGLLNRGVCKMNLGYFKEAVNDYNKVIIIEPNYALAYFNRSVAYEQLNQIDLAKKDQEKYQSLIKS